jgi:hypothetical protein
MPVSFQRCLVVAAICAAAGLGGHVLLRPYAAYAGCNGPGCMAPPCQGPNCLAPPPCDTHPCAALVSDAEAALPDAAIPARQKGRGLIPGPDIIQLSPSPGGVVTSPFVLRIAFRAQGNEPVDPRSVRVVYWKNPVVDLTTRFGGYISAGGIALPVGMLPPGNHTIAVHVADVDYHASTEYITINVRPR